MMPKYLAYQVTKCFHYIKSLPLNKNKKVYQINTCGVDFCGRKMAWNWTFFFDTSKHYNKKILKIKE